MFHSKGMKQHTHTIAPEAMKHIHMLPLTRHYMLNEIRTLVVVPCTLISFPPSVTYVLTSYYV